MCTESPPGDRGQGDGASSLRGWGAGGCSGPPCPFLTPDRPRTGVRPPSPPAPGPRMLSVSPQFPSLVPTSLSAHGMLRLDVQRLLRRNPQFPNPRSTSGEPDRPLGAPPVRGGPLWGAPTTDRPRCLLKPTASRRPNGSSLSVPAPLTPRVAPSP